MRVAITVVLGDLIPSRLILVEIVFSVESTGGLYVAIEGNGSTEGGKKCRSLKFLHQ